MSRSTSTTFPTSQILHMSRPPLPTNPKEDDDSWGKLASDLLGIDLNVDEDLEFPEPEPPAAPPTAEVAAKPPAAIEELPAGFEDEDESSKAPAVPEAFVEAQAVAPEPDAYWSALEEWDWEPDGTTPKPAARTAAPDEGAATGRSSGRERDRDRRGSRDRGGRDRGERERGERGPARERNRDRRREESTGPTERPQRSTRERPPAASTSEAPADRPPTRQPPRRSVPLSSDDFGLGIDDELATVSGEVEDWPETFDTSRTAAGGERDESDHLLEGEEETSPRVTGRREGHPDDEDRPRRRRRRRRRPARGDEAVGPEVERRPSIDDEDEEVEPGDLAEARSADEVDVTLEEAGEGGVRRRRRRRRRRPVEGATETPAERERPRRPEPRPAEAFTEAEDEFDQDEDEVQPPRRVYKDIPTWEEAISYIVKPRSPEPRGRQEGGDRRGPRPNRR